MLGTVRRGCRSFGKSVRQALGCEKTYDADAEIFSGSDVDEEKDANDDEALKEEQQLRDIDLLRPDLNASHGFPSNAIRTSRYTLVTAIPLSLLYQFHKVSNIFFLLVAVVALVPGASPINPFSSLVPLILVVGAGILKDLWEDWKRRTADKEANSTRVNVLRDGQFTAVKSSEVQVGDVMLYRLGEEVRADCLILNTSLPDGLTYIETANLDGETNAKTRRAKIQTVQQLGTVEDMEALAFSGDDTVRCYSDAMAARPVRGLCARYCGFWGCCGGGSSTAKKARAGSENEEDIAALAGISLTRRAGQAGAADYDVCGYRASPDISSSGTGRHIDDGKPVKVGIIDFDLSHVDEPAALYDSIEDERTFVAPPGAREMSGLSPRTRVYASDTPLGDQATATMSVTADEMTDGGVNPADLAADEAANKAILNARAAPQNTNSRVAPVNIAGVTNPEATPPPSQPLGGVHILASGLNPDLASWFGQVRLPSGEMVPVTIDQFLPRGCTVRNTEWVLGMVVYTGRHTKMMLNLRRKPNKTTVLSQRLNQINLFLIIFFLVMMVIVCALALRERKRMLRKTDGVRSGYSTWYIQYHLERHGDATLFWWRFLTNFVLLSYLIPLSLYVTLEFNKAMQMLMIGSDNRMAVFDAFSGKLKHARPKTSELNNQLAQVQYIFTDKTGTLTENLMTYVGGYAASASHDERSKPGGLGRCFLAETIPMLVEKSHVARMDRAEAQNGSSPSGNDELQQLKSGHFSVAAATAAAAALSHSTSRQSYTQGQGGIVDEDDPLLVTRRSTKTATDTAAAAVAAARDPRLAHRHRDLPRLDENVLEQDALFRYLRALSLCHSVVCFKAPVLDPADESGEDGEDGDGREDRSGSPSGSSRGVRGAGADKTPSKSKSKKDKKEKKEKKVTSSSPSPKREGADEKRSPSRSKKKSKKDKVGLTSEQAEKEAQRRDRAAKRRRHRQLEQELQSRREAVQSLACMTPRADGNRVFIPNAVPIGESYEDLLAATQRSRHAYEPHQNATHTRDDVHRHGLNNSFLGASVTTSAARTPSHFQPQGHNRTVSAGAMSTGSGVDLATFAGNNANNNNNSSGAFAPLHGHTGSTGWYYSRLHAHSRTGTNLSATLGASNTNRAAVAAAATVANPLEMYIDRTKIYEGQSLDEIALVSAARENGFSLYERTAKQLFVSVLGHIMCYDIIAELEFTPQRKLMSILIRRNPDGDSVEVATAASAARNTHYHRDKDSTEEEAEGASSPASHGTATAVPRSARGGALLGGEVPSATSASPRHRSHDTHEPSLYTDTPVADEADDNTSTMEPLMRATTVEPSHLRAGGPDAGRRAQQDASLHTAHATHSATWKGAFDGVASTSGNTVFGASQHSRRSSGIRQEVSASSFMNTTEAERPYLLLVKGADSAMLDIVDFNNPANGTARVPLMADLDELAKTGLRTLILGQRIVSDKEVKAWLPVFNEASCAMTHRSERLHEAYAMIERDVDLIGTTAVEDKLQEGVPETLEFFSKANIIVWMLTGDKRETAVTIAQTSGLVAAGFAEAMCHLDISDLLLEEATVQHHVTHKPADSPTADTITGSGVGVADGGETTGTASQSTPRKATDVKNNRNSSSPTDPASPDQVERRKRILAIRARMAERIEDQLAAAEQQCQESKAAHGASQCVLVVDGKTLDYIFSDPRRSRRFFDLGSLCRSAVCCRMTPLQKSSIVRMFQRNTRAVAVAVGDGANDVSMIQEARIGIGVMGLEGSQAELASDYAIPKFRFLKRLLFVHGRFSQYRDAHCILYSLYKNVLLTTGLCVYMFYCGFSGLSFIDSWLLAMFSIFFCSLQPLMIGILDKDVEDELAETLPDIYPPLSRENMYMSFPYIVKWLTDGLIEGLLFFFFIYYTTAQNEDLYRSGLMGGVEDYGQIFFTMMCLVCDLRVGVIISYYMILFLAAVIVELAMIPICEIVYAHINNLAGSNWCVLIADNLYASGKFWLFLLASCGVLAVYTMATMLYMQMFKPWINAGPAMNAMRASTYRQEHDSEKEALLREYAQRLELQKKREMKGLEEVERKMRESVISG